MLQLILPPTENVLPGNKERRTNEKNRITPPWRKYLEQRQPFYRMDRCRFNRKGIADANQTGILLKEKDFILIKLTLLFKACGQNIKLCPR